MTRSRRCLIAGVVAASLVFVGSGPAWAHVTVSPDTATQGTDAVLSFAVPTESDTLETSAVEIDLPSGVAFDEVSVGRKPGWSVSIGHAGAPGASPGATGELSGRSASPAQADPAGPSGSDSTVSKVVWTALDTAAEIPAGQFDTFTLRLGPLPTGADSLTFKAIQTYSDGSVVRWIEQAAPGSAEPAHPAPVLRLISPAPVTQGTTSAPGHATDTGAMKMAAGDMSGMNAGGTEMGGMNMASMTTSQSDTVNLALGLAALALVVGLVGVVVAGTWVTRARRGANPHAGH